MNYDDSDDEGFLSAAFKLPNADDDDDDVGDGFLLSCFKAKPIEVEHGDVALPATGTSPYECLAAVVNRVAVKSFGDVIIANPQQPDAVILGLLVYFPSPVQHFKTHATNTRGHQFCFPPTPPHSYPPKFVFPRPKCFRVLCSGRFVLSVCVCV